MRRLAWTFAALIGYKYQIRLTRSTYILKDHELHSSSIQKCSLYSCPTRFGQTYDYFSLLCKQMDIYLRKVYIVRKVTHYLNAETHIILVCVTYIACNKF